jgi:hypothetical protein
MWRRSKKTCVPEGRFLPSSPTPEPMTGHGIRSHRLDSVHHIANKNSTVSGLLLDGQL